MYVGSDESWWGVVPSTRVSSSISSDVVSVERNIVFMVVRDRRRAVYFPVKSTLELEIII